MGWLDDLATRAQQSVENATNSINDYLGTEFKSPTVKIGEPAKGNQTAAEIAKGNFGGPSAVAPAKAPAAAIANANPGFKMPDGLMKYLPWVAAAGAAVLILPKVLKKRKG